MPTEYRTYKFGRKDFIVFKRQTNDDSIHFDIYQGDWTYRLIAEEQEPFAVLKWDGKSDWDQVYLKLSDNYEAIDNGRLIEKLHDWAIE